jgi:hypothetical protein
MCFVCSSVRTAVTEWQLNRCNNNNNNNNNDNNNNHIRYSKSDGQSLQLRID